jgi:hypothetical protein
VKTAVQFFEELPMTAKRKSSGPRSPNPVHSSDIEEQIRRRAYELYEQRGRVDGFSLNDWLQAESEIRGMTKLRSKAKQVPEQARS